MENISSFLDIPDNNITRKSDDFIDSIQSLEVKDIPEIEVQIPQTTGPATKFTYDLFMKKPHLFGINSFSLLYTKFCGMPYPSDGVYEMFRQFITYGNENRIKLQRLGQIEGVNPLVLKYETHTIITWARMMRHLQTGIIFEPVMTNLNITLNNYLNNMKVSYKGHTYTLDSFKPLCYNKCGENYLNLLPYICYIMTFLIHCKPYSFNEEYSHASSYGFTTALENWFKIQYNKLGKDYGMDVISNDFSSLSTVSDDVFKTLIDHMLDPKYIVEIRNEVMNKEELHLDDCISDQNGLDVDFVKYAWEQTMNNLIDIVVNNTPVKDIFDKFSQFNPAKVNVSELMSLTQYCLAGGNIPFCIDNDYSYMLHGDPKSIKGYPDKIIGSSQKLTSKIKSLTIAKQRPFSCSDLLLECCMSYIREKYDAKRMDLEDPNPIVITTTDLKEKNLKTTLIELFVQGLWMYDNSSMSVILTLLFTNGFNINFVEQMLDLMTLDYITKSVYDNIQASMAIVPYLLSFMNSMLLRFCNNNYNIKYFDIFSYIVNAEFNVDRAIKIENMINSILHIYNPTYYEFINYITDEFTKIMEKGNPIIQIPYVKGFNDKADAYAIGGAELYNYAAYSNPLVRGYGFYANVFGNTENIEAIYQYVKDIKNTAALEIIETDAQNIGVISSVLRNQLEKQNRPNILKNYVFNANGTYNNDLSAYVITLNDSEGKNVLELLIKYIFKSTKANEISDPTIISREVKYLGNGHLKVGPPVESKMIANNIELPLKLSSTGTSMMIPLYDLRGEVISQSIIYSIPAGKILLPLILFNSRVDKNSVVWVFTSTKISNTFDMYAHSKSVTSPQSSDGSYIDRIIPTKTLMTSMIKNLNIS